MPGRITISTPTKPTSSAATRPGVVRSPSIGQASSATSSGEARLIAAAGRVEIAIETAAHSLGVVFDERVREALQAAAVANGSSADAVVCFAGHDAGVIGEQRPAGMVLVRNERGISHSGAEYVEVADAAVATRIVIDAIEELA